MPGNLKNHPNFRFSNLLYLNFIVLKKHAVDETSKAWYPKPIHRDTLYRKINGKNPFTVDDLPGLVRATENAEYLEFVANQCGYTIIPIIKDKRVASLVSTLAEVLQKARNGNEEK